MACALSGVVLVGLLLNDSGLYANHFGARHMRIDFVRFGISHRTLSYGGTVRYKIGLLL